jgi:hypothetical protein
MERLPKHEIIKNEPVSPHSPTERRVETTRRLSASHGTDQSSLPSWRYFVPHGASIEPTQRNQNMERMKVTYWSAHSLTAALENNVHSREELVEALEAKLASLDGELEECMKQHKHATERHAGLIQSMQPMFSTAEQRLASALASVLTIPQASLEHEDQDDKSDTTELVKLGTPVGSKRLRDPARTLKDDIRICLERLGEEKKQWKLRHKQIMREMNKLSAAVSFASGTRSVPASGELSSGRKSDQKFESAKLLLPVAPRPS